MFKEENKGYSVKHWIFLDKHSVKHWINILFMQLIVIISQVVTHVTSQFKIAVREMLITTCTNPLDSTHGQRNITVSWQLRNKTVAERRHCELT